MKQTALRSAGLAAAALALGAYLAAKNEPVLALLCGLPAGWFANCAYVAVQAMREPLQRR